MISTFDGNYCCFTEVIHIHNENFILIKTNLYIFIEEEDEDDYYDYYDGENQPDLSNPERIAGASNAKKVSGSVRNYKIFNRKRDMVLNIVDYSINHQIIY